MKFIYRGLWGMLILCLVFGHVFGMSELAHIVYTKDFLRYQLSVVHESKRMSGSAMNASRLLTRIKATKLLLSARDIVVRACGNKQEYDWAYKALQEVLGLDEGEIADEAKYWLGVIEYKERNDLGNESWGE